VASKNGHLEIFRLLLENQGADDTRLQNNGRDTSLFSAATIGHVDVVRLLLKYGADIHLQSKDGETPLTVASKNGHWEVVRLLLNRGADINLQNKDGETVLSVAAKNGHLNAVLLLLNRGADINIQNKDGEIPLAVAAKNGHLKVVESFLFDNAANITHKNKDGETPLALASKNGHVAVVRLLLNQGAHTRPLNHNSETPLFSADGRRNAVMAPQERLPPEAPSNPVVLCIVCLDGTIDCVFTPCGHMICCRQCGNRLQHCPYCRSRVQALVGVFLP
jgi:ankyrin repeat protein